MGLRDIGATLPPGFRFFPSDEELVCYYLYKKITDKEVLKNTLVEIDLHKCEPWQLPEVAKLNANEWYFFSFRDRKYTTGFRTNRATISGYWKATGKDRVVLDSITREIVGMRKTLVFYKSRAPNGIKTGWIMHEFRLETPNMPPKTQEDWVLCRVFHKGKSENNHATLSPPMMETTDYCDPSLNFSSSTSNRTVLLPCGYNQIQNTTLSSTGATRQNHNQRSSLSNLLQFSWETNNDDSTTTQICPPDDDEYGFLWDMELEDNNLDKGMASNFEDTRFDIDHNTAVFL